MHQRKPISKPKTIELHKINNKLEALHKNDSHYKNDSHHKT